MSISGMAIGREDIQLDGTYNVQWEDLPAFSVDISLESDAIALESMIGDMVLAIKEGLGSTIDGLGRSVGSFRRGLFTSDKAIVTLSETVPFLALEKTIVSVPDSFKGYLADYTRFITETNGALQTDILKVLKKHEVKLSSIVSNDRYNGMVNYNKDFKNENVALNKSKADYQKYFPKNTGKQIATVPSVYGNWKEIIDVDNALDQRSKEAIKLTNKDTLEEVTAQVNKVSELLGVLREGVKSSDNKKRIRTLKDIASSIFLLSQHVEFFSVMTYAHMNLIEFNKTNITNIIKEGDK